MVPVHLVVVSSIAKYGARLEVPAGIGGKLPDITELNPADS
jgi:hypothetical protein